MTLASSLLYCVQCLFAALYVALIIVTIPLAFDVGGHDCGLAYTFTLSIFYVAMSTIRFMFRKTSLAPLGWLIYYSQHIIIPSLLIVHLSLFSDNQLHPMWISLLNPWQVFLSHATPLFTTLEGFCTLLVIQSKGQAVRRAIRRSDTWLLIQLVLSGLVLTGSLFVLHRVYTFPAAIEIASATLIGVVLTTAVFLGLYGIVSRRGTAIESSLIFAYVVYYLYVTYSDFQSANSLSSLLPAWLIPPSPSTILLPPTSVVSAEPTNSNSGPGWQLPFFKPASAKLGSLVSAAGSMAHVVASTTTSSSSSSHVPPAAYAYTQLYFPPNVVTGYVNFLSMIAERIPEGFVTIYKFLAAVSSTVTPSVAITLAYRLFVFHMATRIIPRLKEQQLHPHYAVPVDHASDTPPPASPTSPPKRRISKSKPVLFVISSYAPCILIAVYTHLLIQHSALFGGDADAHVASPAASLWSRDILAIIKELIWGTSIQTWKFWGWVNIFSTLALYALELAYGDNQALDQTHYKND